MCVIAVAVKDSDRPDEITNDGWSLFRVCSERLGTAPAAERARSSWRSQDAIVKCLTSRTDIHAIVEVPQVHDDRFSRAEWHEHDLARKMAFPGSTKTFDLDGEKIQMRFSRSVTVPFPSEGRVELHCSRGHKSLKARVEFVKAARKAKAKGETSAEIQFVNVRSDSEPVISGGR